MRRSGMLLAVAALVTSTVGSVTFSDVAGASRDNRAERFIVVLDDGADSRAIAADHSRRHDAQVSHVYQHALRGYAATMSPQAAARVANDSRVAYVELDGVATTAHHRNGHDGGPGGDDGGGGGETPTTCTQELPWGIDRVDADGSSARADGCGTNENFTGVNVYVIDTGADTGHADLNVVNHVNFAGGPNKDCHGHGTHVAGTIAAIDNDGDVVGALPGAPVTGVRVLGCSGSGSWSGVIAGIDWVTAHHQKPAVANMSLGGSANSAVDDAVRNSATAGVVYSIAAGNSGADACNSSPARAGAGTNNGIITTAATDTNDNETSWSNYGDCVDVWAPGAGVLSTAVGGGTTTMSGTSMAAPHVGGVAAVFLEFRWTNETPGQVEATLKSNVLDGGTSKDNTPVVVPLATGY